MPGTVYILTNHPNGILYTGATADLSRRIFEHLEGRGSVFTRRYGLTRLVYYKHHDDIRAAIQRERNLKHLRGHGERL